jgi:UDP-glucuronate decarboxylase
LATAPTDEVAGEELRVVDVRDLVDRGGNSDQIILSKIDAAAKLLKENVKVVICCDYGVSRSNAIAAGVLAKHLKLDFDEAVQLVVTKTGEAAIGLDLLNSVRRALRPDMGPNRGRGKTILVTGRSGLIGAGLIETLTKSREVVTPDDQELGLLDQPMLLDRLVRRDNVETLVHLARPAEYATPKSMGQSVVMLKNVLDVCRENRLRLLMVSDSAVFSGYRDSCLIASESIPLRPRGTYGETKALCESLVHYYRDAYGLDICLLRLSRVYGNGAPKFIQAFCERALKNEVIFTHKYVNGFPMVDLVHVSDVVNAIERIIENKPSQSTDFNIGTGVGRSTFELAEMIRTLCHSTSSIKYHEINDFTSNVVMDISKAEKLLQWRPTINISDGLKQIVDHVRERVQDGPTEKQRKESSMF